LIKNISTLRDQTYSAAHQDSFVRVHASKSTCLHSSLPLLLCMSHTHTHTHTHKQTNKQTTTRTQTFTHQKTTTHRQPLTPFKRPLVYCKAF
jgi:hypothetical protein